MLTARGPVGESRSSFAGGGRRSIQRAAHAGATRKLVVCMRMPFCSESEKHLPLRKCLKRAADHSGITEYQAAMVVSFFWEELMEQVAVGQPVNLPGFGMFAPRAWQPRHDPEAAAYCFPAFSASRVFRQHVKRCCPPSGAAIDAILKHRQHHHPSSRPERASARPSSAMAAFRADLRAQARREGLVLPPEPQADFGGLCHRVD